MTADGYKPCAICGRPEVAHCAMDDHAYYVPMRAYDRRRAGASSSTSSKESDVQPAVTASANQENDA